jgi:hypothetical protein
VSIARTDFRDPVRRCRGKSPGHPADPRFIPHEKIDPPQIATTALRSRISGREVIEQFRDNDSVHRQR